jgi:hypothetical protein
LCFQTPDIGLQRHNAFIALGKRRRHIGSFK